MSRCLACHRPKSSTHWGLCKACQRSFDRMAKKEHTIMSVIVWAAKRARRTALAERRA